MEHLKKIIAEHEKRYPMMTGQDFVKLIYQNEFGCGHFVTDENKSLERIRNEILTVHGKNNIDFEDIGGGFVRLWFSENMENQISLNTINKMFLMSAEKREDFSEFKKKLAVLWDMCLNNEIKISIDEMKTYLKDYESLGFPMVSHSDIFHREYKPSYRVIKKQFSVYFPVIQMTDLLLRKNKQAVIAVDGRCSSGKSTLAGVLKEIFDGEIISADDFFLPFEKRTAERLNECGGNLDYERFKSQVIEPLKSTAEFSYDVFSCRTGKTEGKKHIERKPLLIVEGSYSCHEYFGQPYDLRIFLTVDEKIQKERILKRNGEKMLKVFTEKWIPMEEKYFAGQKIREKADLVLDTENL